MVVFQLHEYAEVSSTNDIVKHAAEAGEAQGYAVRADVQTAGYGRQGRTWASPAGGVYLSLLLRPRISADLLAMMPLASALGVRRALASFVAPEAADALQIKWPNDLVVPEDNALSDRISCRKLAGLSHEWHAGSLIVGIGVNVVPPEGDAAALSEVGGKNVPVYLRELSGASDASVNSVTQAVLHELSQVYETWMCGNAEALMGEYGACAYLTGRCVTVKDRNGATTCEGVARGIDVQGRLLVEDTAGTVHAVSSGEAHLA